MTSSRSSVSSPLLHTLASRIRHLREQQGRTRRDLAERSGLSVRFLARVEAGDGNISVLRLQALAEALDTTPDALLRPAADPRRPIALVGLRGAGKSTVGPLLAKRLGLAFVEMDTMIQEASGLSLEELFELHGEWYYRRLEAETVRRILAGGEPVVVAAAGGVVNEPETWELLREHAVVVWLRAGPEKHWDRVLAQGDRRPMGDNPAAMEELRSLLSAREPIYSQAQLTVDTGSLGPDEIAQLVEQELDELE